jgi:hypothetical protein
MPSCHPRTVVVLRRVLAWRCWLAELPWQRGFDVTAFSSEVARLAQQQEVLQRTDERVTVFDCEAVMNLLGRVIVAVLAVSVLSCDLLSSQG